ncbi:hypothetical protein [Phenylobacterium sp.]|uniref:hypothetical protein n=1 Tax=Phenylobacterium sp. TaxID=1871053 RepID=UPI003918F451
MAEESQQPRDLFGDPWTPPRDPRGRRSHRPTAQGREIVAQLKGGGASDDDIALQLGLCVKTLRKYYFRELDHGVSLARNEVLRKLYEKAMAGNVTAMRAYLRETEKGAAVQAMRLPRPSAAEKPKGKKEQRLEDAAKVGGLYEPGRPPGSATSH